jgi:hypothetical protein
MRDGLIEALGGASPSRRTLVLCRTGVAASYARLQIAEAGGALGVAVLTPLGLAQAVSTPSDAPEPAWEPSVGLWREVADRPGLLQALRSHADAARLAERAGVALPGPVRALGEGAPAPGPLAASWLELLDLAAARGPRLGAGYDFDRVLAVGFGAADQGWPLANPAERALLGALGAASLVAPVRSDGPIDVPVTAAADVVAEARWVAGRVAAWRDAGGDVSRALVLVAQGDDGDRVRMALARAGVPAAEPGSATLRSHALYAWVYQALPWFTPEPDPRVRGEALRAWWQSRLLKGGWPDSAASAREALARDIAQRPELKTEDGADPSVMSRRQVPRLLSACHLTEAPLSVWRAALLATFEDAGQPPWLRRQARVGVARLDVLGAARAPQEGGGCTLGQLRAWVTGQGVKTWLPGGPDLVALAILEALKDRADRPATEGELNEALGGAASRGNLDGGVQVLTYREYDGRGSDALWLTGLHGRGIARAPGPDPFLDEGALRALGVVAGDAAVDLAERQLADAARRAGRVEAVFPSRAGDGRATPPHLALLARGVDGGPLGVTLHRRPPSDPDAKVDSYGLRLTQPEIRDLRQLQRRDVAPGAARPEPGDAAERLAAQAALEWLREGGCVDDFHPTAADPLTVADHVALHAPAIPAWARPWWGDTRGVERVALPADAVLTASTGFEALAHCGFQAWGKLVLGLQRPDELRDDLDASEVGTATHDALRAVGHDPRWRPSTAEEAATARADLTAELVARSEAQIGKISAPTEALRLARDGVARRWANHWPQYVDVRVTAPGADALTRALVSELTGHDGISAVVDLLETWIDAQPKPWIVKDRRGDLEKWVKTAAAVVAQRGWGDPDVWKGLTKAPAAMVRELYERGELEAPFAPLVEVAAARRAFHEARLGPVVQAAPEWSFGRHPRRPDAPARALRLGDVEVEVAGDIDLVRANGAPGAQVVSVVDYKSWSARRSGAEIRTKMKELTYAQVPAYALVVRQALAEGWGPEGMSAEPIGWRIGYDAIRFPKEDGVAEVQAGGVDLDRARDVFASQIRAARAGESLPIPHPLACPAMADRGHDYCPLQDVCRVRALPGQDRVALAAPEEEEA